MAHIIAFPFLGDALITGHEFSRNSVWLVMLTVTIETDALNDVESANMPKNPVLLKFFDD